MEVHRVRWHPSRFAATKIVTGPLNTAPDNCTNSALISGPSSDVASKVASVNQALRWKVALLKSVGPVNVAFMNQASSVNVALRNPASSVNVTAPNTTGPVNVAPSNRASPVNVAPSNRALPVNVASTNQARPMRGGPSAGCRNTVSNSLSRSSVKVVPLWLRSLPGASPAR